MDFRAKISSPAARCVGRLRRAAGRTPTPHGRTYGTPPHRRACPNRSISSTPTSKFASVRTVPPDSPYLEDAFPMQTRSRLLIRNVSSQLLLQSVRATRCPASTSSSLDLGPPLRDDAAAIASLRFLLLPGTLGPLRDHRADEFFSGAMKI